MRLQLLAVVALLLLFPAASRAGGPAFIAGSGYDPGVEGQPLLWANATVQYYTDQGALSPILTNAQADALVANAITPWTTAAGVGLTVTQAGHLAEDVNGSNIQVTNGVITAPADITPSATSTPLGIVYDYDGTVTDALLGEGAGSAEDCFTNAVYGGPDNFSASGNIVHALAVINGVCAAASTQLPDVQYRLIRVLARILGLGWSQANLNVITNNPPPTADEYLGFPVMHFADPVSCVPITICYGGIFGGALGNYTITPALDDATAFASLYPAPGGNPQPTGGLWGGVYFTDASGNAAQMMQGVNVVARMVVSGQPSGQYVVTSVSGYPFVGNAGNIITGYVDANGLRFDRFGSSDQTVEGFYNLSQLVIPAGQSYAEYQLSVEALDPIWSMGVGPYAPTQVEPSGEFAPVVVTVASGTNSETDILMLGSEVAEPHPGSGSSYVDPVPLPEGGAWGSWIFPYGSADFFAFTAQANRTASVAVTALDESGNSTESKLLPIVGIWELSDQSGNPAPAATPSAFNTPTFGMTRLDAQFGVSEAYRVGIADYRGDGRPDYFYQASLLYSDTLTPARVSVAGGLTTLQGIGFKPGLEVSAGGNNGTVLTESASQMLVALPPAAQDGVTSIQVTDPITGSFSQMIGALTYGAGVTDLLLLLQGNEPTTPVGAQAANPIRVRATASDGVTPVNGATIAWSSTNSIQFSACNGVSSCSVLTDEAGEASTWVTPTATGSGTITAALAPASYSPAQSQQTTLLATSSSLDLAAITPTLSIAQGATLSLPLTVEALNHGVPQANVAIAFTVSSGTASLSSTTATTNSSGLASVTAQITNLNSNVQVSACVAPANNPCQTFTLSAVPASAWTLEPVSGTSQAVPDNQSFQPLVMRVTDGSAADNPVLGASVTFLTTLERNPQGPGEPVGPSLARSNRASRGTASSPQGNAHASPDDAPIILGTSQTQIVTDQNGLASITPTVGNLGPCDAFVTVTAGPASSQFELESVDPIVAEGQQPPLDNSRSTPSVPHPVGSLPSPASPEAASALFAVPQEMPATQDFDTPSDPSSVDSSGGGSPPIPDTTDPGDSSSAGNTVPSSSAAIVTGTTGGVNNEKANNKCPEPPECKRSELLPSAADAPTARQSSDSQLVDPSKDP